MNLFRGQKVEGQGHRVTKCKSIAASTRYVRVLLLQRGYSFTLPLIDTTQFQGITIFLKLTEGRQPPGADQHSSDEPGELSK